MKRVGICDQVKSAMQDLVAPALHEIRGQIHAVHGEMAAIRGELQGVRADISRVDTKIDNVDALGFERDRLRRDLHGRRDRNPCGTRS